MANPQQLAKLMDGVEAWNEWRDLLEDNFSPDLRDASLEKLSLKRVNLQNANLSGTNLSGSDLRHAHLEGATLDGSNLSGANLLKANLTGANLHSATLDDVNLDDAILAGANLSLASLNGAILTGAFLAGANLQGAFLDAANFNVAQLQGANLEGATLSGATLIRASLQGAKLARANLWDASLEGAKLWGADLSSAELMKTELKGAELWGANLKDIMFLRRNYRTLLEHKQWGAYVDDTSISLPAEDVLPEPIEFLSENPPDWVIQCDSLGLPSGTRNQVVLHLYKASLTGEAVVSHTPGRWEADQPPQHATTPLTESEANELCQLLEASFPGLIGSARNNGIIDGSPIWLSIYHRDPYSYLHASCNLRGWHGKEPIVAIIGKIMLDIAHKAIGGPGSGDRKPSTDDS